MQRSATIIQRRILIGRALGVVKMPCHSVRESFHWYRTCLPLKEVNFPDLVILGANETGKQQHLSATFLAQERFQVILSIQPENVPSGGVKASFSGFSSRVRFGNIVAKP